MNLGISRRDTLRITAVGTGGLLLGLHLLPAGRVGSPAAAQSGANVFAPNAFVRIAGNGRIILIVDKCEVGQGVYTSLPMLLAEELDVGLDQVTTEPSPPNEALMPTRSCTCRRPGIRARCAELGSSCVGLARLRGRCCVAAAAARWHVNSAECRAERAEVIHDRTGRRLSYGALAEEAAKQPVPNDPPLKRPDQFRILGKLAGSAGPPRQSGWDCPIRL